MVTAVGIAEDGVSATGLVMVTLGGVFAADRHIYDAGGGGETEVVCGHCGERVGADGESGRNGVGCVVGPRQGTCPRRRMTHL